MFSDNNQTQPTINSETTQKLTQQFIHFMETGESPAGLFTVDVFCDFTLPLWRLQAQGIDAVVALRHQGHPWPGTISRWRCDPTPTGFVFEFEERWQVDRKNWYARELARADVKDGSISHLSIYCTGDWDEKQMATHTRAVRLLRP